MSQYLIGVQHGLAPGIPNIEKQPWKVLEVAIANTESQFRPKLYHDWQLLYGQHKPSKMQKKDLAAWGLISANL